MTAELLGLYDEVVDHEALARTIERFRERNIVLPTFSQLADPSTLPEAVPAEIEAVGPDDADARNLWRVHWYN
ncbi:MAG: pyridoxal-5'-phosphate-dependent protein subunit beta, partial [Acidimicrobiia bacterium]|nr:pyridoxal-5'-phosphate-dependent protein subunit beta [Acidimicrobiia bacterium]